MDKQTGSNTSSQSTSESPRDISLGCGPSQASSSAASSPSTATGGNSSSSASAGNSKFAPLTTSATMSPQKIAPSGNIPLPLGAPISGAVVGATQSHQPQQQQQTSLPPPITLNINTTTGGNFSVIVDASNTVENLKKVIARKLKVAKDRICLLHREKELHEGTLKDNGLLDGSKIILIPNVETGLLAQRPENTVMQALESLNDSQVNDFLSGKTPLNLSMRLGDHMMLIQLQLSTVNPVNTAAHSGSSSRTRSSQRSSRSSSSSAAASSGHNHHSHHHHHHHHHHTSSATNSSATTAPVASTSAAARKIDVDTATAGGNNNVNIQGQSQPATTENGTSAIPNLRIPSSPANAIKSSDLSSFLSKRDYESLQNIVRSIAMAQPANLTQSSKVNSFPVQSERKASTSTLSMDSTCCGSNLTSKQGLSTVNAVPSSTFHSSDAALLEQSPIKSLSNLVSSPIKTASIKNIPISSSGNSSSISTGPATASTVISSCQDPISAKLTSCLCTRLGGDIPNSTLKNCVESACQSRKESSETSITESRSTMLTSTPNHKSSSSTTVATSSSLLHKTANNPILRSKHRHHHHHHHHHHHYHHHGNGSTNTNNSITNPGPRKVPVSPRSTSVLSTTNDSGFASEIDSTVASLPAAATPISQSTATANAPVDLDDSGVTLTDTRTLAEASRNLTQTLRKLSKEVFTNKIDLSSEETSRKSNSGAVIESMKNHGKGIYSGTFSGTLNPALQDRYGRPKRDISTVIHILNDLLSATPQYSRGARISFEAPSATSTTGTPATSTGLAGHSTRSKQFPSKHHHHYSHSHVDSCVKCTKTHHHSGVTNSASHICAYGECNGHYTTKPTKHSSSYTCCQDLSAPSSHHHSLQTGDANNHSDRNTCTCRFVVGDSGEREREHMCQKCLVEMENNKTKSKLDQLRLVMQQRKQKREARKLKGAPYGARVVGTTTGVTETAATVTAATTVNGNNTTGSTSLTTPLATASPSEVSPNHIVEEVDTAA